MSPLVGLRRGSSRSDLHPHWLRTGRPFVMSPPAVSTGKNRILLIDDNPEIHLDFRKVLCTLSLSNPVLDDAIAEFFGPSGSTAAAAEFEIDSAYQGHAGLEMVERAVAEGRPYSLAFVDVRMPPGWDGVETITRIWEIDASIQVVICTAYSDYSWHGIVARLGKTDRLVILKKPFDTIEVLQLAHALSEKWIVTQQARHKLEDLNRLVDERTRELQQNNVHLRQEMAERELAQQALKASEDRLSKAFDASPLPVALVQLTDYTCTEFNLAFLRATGFTRQELRGRPFWMAGVGLDLESRIEVLEQLASGIAVRQRPCRLISRTGEERAALLWIERFELATGPHLLAVVQDIFEQQKLETQLRQSQKLEAIGQLAAWVAHDFNNLLTVVEGHISLQLEKTKLDSEIEWSLREVQAAGARAAALTRQLLAFSRKQVMLKRPVVLSDVVKNLESMLLRLIPKNIEIRCQYADRLPCVFADLCNLEQLVVNLVVNARDAMPQGGMITVQVETVDVTPEQTSRHPEARVGPFVLLSIADTGTGMSTETITHIFDPFFTTKEVGKGTGMGLSTVHGIVQQHEGWIEVESALGRGTTFRIFQPVTDRMETSQALATTPILRRQHHDVILLVEDDAAVRSLARCVLEKAGYQVIEAQDGQQAVAAWQTHAGHIDLLLTDMVMPGGLSGAVVAERFRAERPESKVLFCSGYSTDLFSGQLQLQVGFNYLPKPYLARQLTEAVALALTGKDLEAAQ